MSPIAERQSSNPGITDTQQTGLLTAAVSALVVEMQTDRAERKAERERDAKERPSWHLMMAEASVLGAAVGCFFAVAVLYLGGRLQPVVATTSYVAPIGLVTR